MGENIVFALKEDDMDRRIKLVEKEIFALREQMGTKTARKAMRRENAYLVEIINERDAKIEELYDKYDKICTFENCLRENIRIYNEKNKTEPIDWSFALQQVGDVVCEDFPKMAFTLVLNIAKNLLTLN